MEAVPNASIEEIEPKMAELEAVRPEPVPAETASTNDGGEVTRPEPVEEPAPTATPSV